MIPVLGPEALAAVDAAAPEPVARLVTRAGAAVAAEAIDLLGGAYGRRVAVIAGPGNNGADGRVAGRRLAARGARVLVVDPRELAGAPSARRGVGAADLIIDAAFGTGLRRAYEPPDAGDTPVLAVDIPSGLSAVTGEPVGEVAVRAARTVTFAAFKPGLLVGAGPDHAGSVRLAGIGLAPLAAAAAAEGAGGWLVTDADVAAAVKPRPRTGHKWQRAVAVVAGSPGMAGAAALASRAAMRAGSGYVRLGMPGVDLAGSPVPPGEIVGFSLPSAGWARAMVEGRLERFRALVVGPGLGSPAEVGPASEVFQLVAAAPLPAVIDADGLAAIGSLDALAALCRARSHPTVITPHDAEWARLVGAPPAADRLADVAAVARRSGAVVLLKGPATVVAEPGGRVLVASAGGPNLATAGTGDVLSGIIGALLARGVGAAEAAALGAHIHGRAAGTGLAEGLVAGDLPELVARWLSAVPRPGIKGGVTR